MVVLGDRRMWKFEACYWEFPHPPRRVTKWLECRKGHRSRHHAIMRSHQKVIGQEVIGGEVIGMSSGRHMELEIIGRLSESDRKAIERQSGSHRAVIGR